MTTNREHPHRGAPSAPTQTEPAGCSLDRRRADMHAAEGHAGSIPRGNQEPERESVGQPPAGVGARCSATDTAHRRSGLQRGPERLHGGRADAIDLVELVDRGETAVLVAELDDLLGGHRSDPLDPDRAARRSRCRG